MNTKIKKTIIEYLLIVIGSVLYGIGTSLFTFPASIILGGTGGISVILSAWLPFSPGTIISVINILLIVLAFFVLGKSMGVKTLVGSLLTTLSITAIEYLFPMEGPVWNNQFISAVIGASIIAVASGIMFYVDANSGGTDIIALIVKKYSKINIGKALFITDCLIVVVGGVLSGLTLALASALGFIVKILGIEGVTWCIKRIWRDKRADQTDQNND